MKDVGIQTVKFTLAALAGAAANSKGAGLIIDATGKYLPKGVSEGATAHSLATEGVKTYNKSRGISKKPFGKALGDSIEEVGNEIKENIGNVKENTSNAIEKGDKDAAVDAVIGTLGLISSARSLVPTVLAKTAAKVAYSTFGDTKNNDEPPTKTPKKSTPKKNAPPSSGKKGRGRR